jgi:hypothetical protein
MNILTRSEEEILFNQLKQNARINCAPLIQGIFYFKKFNIFLFIVILIYFTYHERIH